ncbi:hypothetical protein HT136_14630 [Novosphingobium profundi]|uniref:hypothetical protein n=1 Tax=Novosphingobium profundi TaxID=1774954 RepID=UPI001BD9F492|nr:hypothetical protein [Novosphingobium profundi]MBT0669600.1 hypothetical protein [Novosphingobium profundi]
MRLTYLLVLATSVSTPALAAGAGNAPPSATGTQASDEDEERDDTKAAVGPAALTGNEIIVTGKSVLPGSVDTPYAPIQTFEEEDIAAYGASSIEELLDAISPQTGSGRGRDSGRPVILVNGKRITSWREMRDIPPEAIKRMEVLPEEVALQFGYPADKRVVNMILKDSFAAVTGSGEYNRPTRGGFDNYELESGIFKIAGPRRYNFTTKLTETSMLTEDERNVVREDGEMPTVAGDPDPRRYRSLADRESEFEVNGTMTQGVGEGGLDGQLTANVSYDRTVSNSLSGLDTFVLESPDGATATRTYDDPLATRVSADTFSAGLGYNTQFGAWQFSVTGDGSYADTETRTDRNRDMSALQDAALAGDFAIDGVLPYLPGAGVDVARNRALTLSSLATLAGSPFELPAGPANLTIKGGYDYSHTRSDDTASDLGAITLSRGDVSGGANLTLPLTSRSGYFLDAIGDLSLNLGGGLNHLSDFGTLTNWTAGLSWSPSDALTFQATYLVEEAAPTLAQLGAPLVTKYNVSVYDFVNSTTALVTTTSGGNPDLQKEKRRDWKISANWKLPILDRSNLLVEYFHNRSNNVSESFPTLTSAVEDAFPDRVTRDAYGNLVAIDRRAVTFDEVTSSSIRWGVNFGGRLGASSADEASRGSGRGGAPRGPQAGAEPGLAPAGSAPSGPGGAMFDPERFAAMRKALCAPVAEGGEPDLSALPEGMRARLMGADGKVDAARLDRMKARICSAEGATPPAFDPARFAAIRAALCKDEGVPDISTLPEPMQARLRKEDGSIDMERVQAMRARLCATAAGGAGTPEGAPQAAQAADGRSARPAGGGAPSFGGRRGPSGGRWNVSIYHTYRLSQDVRIGPGSPVLDELAGDALTAGGVPRHEIEAEGGLFLNGIGLRFKTTWNGPAHVNGSGAPGSSDLRFGAYTVANLRLFIDLGQRESLVTKMPFLKGSRLSLTADRIFDTRQKVTNSAGEIPIAYQGAYREPLGRVVGIDFRKMF